MATSTIKKPETFYTNVNGTDRKLIVKTGSQSIGDNVSTQVNFSTAFPNACFHVALTCYQLGFGGGSTISVGDITKTGFKMNNRNTSSSAMNVGWIAFGY